MRPAAAYLAAAIALSAAGVSAQESPAAEAPPAAPAATSRVSAWIGPGMAVDQAQGLLMRLEGGFGPWSAALGFNGGTEDRAWYLRLGFDAARRIAQVPEASIGLSLGAGLRHDRRVTTVEEFVPDGPNLVREDLRESWELRPYFSVDWGRTLQLGLSLGYGFAFQNRHDGRPWSDEDWGLRWALALRWRLGAGAEEDRGPHAP